MSPPSTSLFAISKAWLEQFEKENGRSLRVLHVGNIANNAYNNAKIQRQRGIEADVLCHDYYHIMGCPEWEDADFTGDFGDPFYPDWWACDLKGFKRPGWFVQGPLILGIDYLLARSTNDKMRERKLWFEITQARKNLCNSDSITIKKVVKTVREKIHSICRLLLLPLYFLIKVGNLNLKILKRRYFSCYKKIVKTVKGIIHSIDKQLLLALSFSKKVGNLNLKILESRYFSYFDSKYYSVIAFKKILLDLSKIIIWAVCIPLFIIMSLFIDLITLTKNFGVNKGIKEIRGYLVKNKSATKAAKSGQIFENSRRIVNYLTRIFGNMNNCSAFIADLFLTKLPQPLRVELKEKQLIKEFAEQFPNREDKLSRDDLLAWMNCIDKWSAIFDQYDVVQVYATFPIIPLLLGFKRFAAYEHGTIREIPFENNAQGRICAIGYKLAPVVFITNSDNLLAAKRLNLDDDQLFCLPHAFDNEKLFSFDRENEDCYHAPVDQVVFFSPSRQHWKDRDLSMAKGNDIIFHAIHSLKIEGYDFVLELVEWGRDVEDSKQLISELEIEDYIVWIPTMKKRQLWQKYMSVHAVIDQILLPALGGVGFETMALGRRLLTAMDMQLGEKFFGAPPPLFDVRDTPSLKDAMRSVLDDPQDSRGIGNDAREWIRQYHSADRVCQIQVDAYRKIMMMN